MSYSRIVCLVKMFFLFFYRNILCFGMLRSKIFRVLAGTVMVGLVALVAVVMTLFFHNVDSSLQQTSIVLDTYCCSVIMLTFVVFEGTIYEKGHIPKYHATNACNPSGAKYINAYI